MFQNEIVLDIIACGIQILDNCTNSRNMYVHIPAVHAIVRNLITICCDIGPNLVVKHVILNVYVDSLVDNLSCLRVEVPGNHR